MSTEDVTAEREGLAEEIAGVLAEHRLVGERYLREKHGHADVCACGSLHPKFEGRWPTHRTHLADALADLLAARDRRVRAEAVREYRDALAGNESAEFWSRREDFLHDLSDWATCVEEKR